MKRFSWYLISACDEKKLIFLKDDVIYFYFVKDKSSFVWKRWMSYGLCFLAEWMVKPQRMMKFKSNLRRSWSNKIMKMSVSDHEEIWRWRWMQRRRFNLEELNSNEEIQESMLRPSMKTFKFNIFPRLEWKCIWRTPSHSRH